MQLSLAMFDTGAGTHAGRVRHRNEDRYLSMPDTGLWAVADGMGGHEAGEFASQTVVDALSAIAAPSTAADLLSRCEQQIVVANGRLRDVSRQRGGAVLGTTIAVLLAFDRHYACIWSGDSRIYVVRGGAITQLSRDHTEVQRLLAQGAITPEEARNWPGSNVITRAIGVFDQPELELVSGALEAGDSFIICSDGLTQHIEDREILDCVTSGGSQQACDMLIELTLARGASDNVTVVVVRYQPDPDGTTRPVDMQQKTRPVDMQQKLWEWRG
jgi:serine/threonine protein phosphatase PrpC